MGLGAPCLETLSGRRGLTCLCSLGPGSAWPLPGDLVARRLRRRLVRLCTLGAHRASANSCGGGGGGRGGLWLAGCKEGTKILYSVTVGNKGGSALFMARKGKEINVYSFPCTEHFARL